MKSYLKTVVIANFLAICLTLFPNIVNAQLGDPGDDPDAPIDGGISLLIAAGVGYGYKKARDSRKKSAISQNVESK
jgi:hypothetical protein